MRDPGLVPQAIEEVLRFEPPPHAVGRYVTKDVEFHGQTVPEGSEVYPEPHRGGQSLTRTGS